MKVIVFTDMVYEGGRRKWERKEHDTESLEQVEASNGDYLLCEGKWYVREQFGNRRRMHIAANVDTDPSEVPKHLRLAALILT